MNILKLSRLMVAILLFTLPMSVFVGCSEADEVDKTEQGDQNDDDQSNDGDDSGDDNSGDNSGDDNNDSGDNNDNSGDDNSSDDGDEALPEPVNSYYVTSKSEFDSAVKAVAPGDEIVLANGTWTDIEFEFDADGEEGNMIYLRGEEPDKVFISGSSQIKFGGDYLYVYNLTFNGCVATSTSSKGTIVEFRNGSSNEAYHCVLSDCYFDACVPTDKSFDDAWVNLYGQYNTVQRCYMGGKDNMGLYIIVWHKNEKADYHTIRKNYFYRPDTYNSQTNGQEIIRIGDSTNSITDSSTLIEENFFYQCNGEIEIISIKSGDNTVRYNTFLESQGCVTLRHGDYNIIANNYFIANNVSKAGGVRVINKGHIIYNNYFYGQISDDERAAISLQLGLEDGALNEYDPVEDVTIANNTMVNCKQNFSFGVGSADVVPSNVLIVGALVVTDQTSSLIDTNSTDTSGIAFSCSHLESTKGVESGDGLITGSYDISTMTIAGKTVPKLVAKTTYILAPDYVTEDISGVTRESSTPIGAIADSAAAPSNIATNTNCGPNWSGWYKPL